ncbi:MAG: hypothetical protein Q8L24_01945 [bacterium]|nr:hypothetical protein [bacterium]
MFKRLAGLAVSGAIFPVKLVIFPVMAVVAMLHGVLGCVTVIVVDVMKNFGTVAMAPFAACSVVRIASDKIDPKNNDRWVPYGFAGVYGLILLMNSVTRGGILADSGGLVARAPGDTFMRVLAVLWATNILSCLYEGGRAYCNYLTTPSSGRPEVPEANPPAGGAAPQSFLTMFNKIEKMYKISEDEAWALTAEIDRLGSEGKIKFGEMINLTKMIVARIPTPAVVY